MGDEHHGGSPLVVGMAPMEGFLWKQGERGIIRAFKHRWFKQDEEKLHYYGKGEAKPRGHIDLKKISEIVPVDKPSKEGRWQFVVRVPGRDFVLQAESQEDQMHWVRGLYERLDLLRDSRSALTTSQAAAAAAGDSVLEKFSLPEDEQLITEYSCSYYVNYIRPESGRIYITSRHVCFRSKFLGYETKIVIPLTDVASIEKRNTALVIPNGIEIETHHGTKHFFGALLTRDQTYENLEALWKGSKLSTPLGGTANAALALDQQKFQLRFKLPETEELVTQYACAYYRQIPHQGQMYVSANYCCFRAKAVGLIEEIIVSIPLWKVEEIVPRSSALVVPNALELIISPSETYYFSGLVKRDETLEVLINLWKQSLVAHGKRKNETKEASISGAGQVVVPEASRDETHLFRTLFPSLPDSELLVKVFECTLAKGNIIKQPTPGRLFLSLNHLCFCSGNTSKPAKDARPVVDDIPFKNIVSIAKRQVGWTTSAIKIITTSKRLLFSDFHDRDTAHQKLIQVWSTKKARGREFGVPLRELVLRSQGEQANSSGGGGGGGGGDASAATTTTSSGALPPADAEAARRREKRELPVLVDSCLKQLRARGLREANLFKASPPNKEEAIAVKESLEDDAHADLSTVHPHAIAGTLKDFLRELPDIPLLPTDVLFTLDLQSKEASLRRLRGLIIKAPKENKNLLRALAYFLAEVAGNAAENKMNATLLSVIFGPILFLPRDTDPQSLDLYQSSVLQEAVRLLIEEREALFNLDLSV